MILQNQETRNQAATDNQSRRFISPSVNIYETIADTQIIVDMPGVDEKSVDISYEKDILTIEGKNSFAISDGYEAIYSEFKTGDYLRKFIINKPIDLDNSRAVMKNGKLTLFLSKIKTNTKKIEVKTE